ncbi:MAG: class I SAM-dependent methyltransferase [Pseudomonas sp.]|nr:class I SAM-dependent methyltransferase [Pseudomonas sp.]MDD2223549.1 class I SAM-dependent methyltransferase [Pseudomonas sp.]MDY0413974.1 class I SAM-dependent methyltransferase [Pseudomonas sp.]NLO53125.1 class I SAM-dependent methyltransferase [Gammaproteobacteria bacterium]
MYSDLTFGHDDELIDELRDLDYDQDDYGLAEHDFRDLNFDDDSDGGADIILDVPYVPTDEKIVQAMLDLAEVSSKDVLYDLGCGDGRIVVAAAAERNARGVGIDIDPMRITEAIEYAAHTRVEYLTHFFEGDLLEADFSQATVVTLYLLDLVNLQLRPRLLDELRPGTRIVSHSFNMGDWKADQRQDFSGISLYKWIVPAKVAGTWQWQASSGETYRVELKQKYQKVTGRAWIDQQPALLTSALLQGDLLELILSQDTNSRPARFLMRCQAKQLLAAEGDLQATPALKITRA